MPKGKSLSVDMRNKLIIDKFQSGERQSDISKQLNLNRSVISKTISLYNQRRSLVNVTKSGRPRKTARITERKIGMLSRQNPF
jgi:DNA-binding transcriptional regulator LsrR (DeoR family)